MTRRIALLGAPGTGKTQLAEALATHWRALGRRVALLPDPWRGWQRREGRPPRAHEALLIAHEQERQADTAARGADILIADGTALAVAVHAELRFGDRSLYPFAQLRQRAWAATVLTGLDLPATRPAEDRPGSAPAEGSVASGPPISPESFDALMRGSLAEAGVAYRVVYGSGGERLHNALVALEAASSATVPQRPWAFSCEKCSDPDCEHRLFTALIAGRPDDKPSGGHT